MTVVNEPIKNWYEEYYKISGIGVVPNIPVNPYYFKKKFSKKICLEKNLKFLMMI